MIISKGQNIFPSDIEEIIGTHPKVAEVAVVGIADEARGETPRAVIRLKAGEEATEQEIKRFCLEHLANYKVPKEVIFTESLPKTADGKIRKEDLKMKRRVVVTGMGAVTPLGVGVEASWQALCQGKSGVGSVTSFDASNFRTRIAGEVKGFNPLDFIDRKLARRGDRFIHFALAAARMAMEDSGLKINAANAERVGVSVGTAMGGIESIEKNHELLLKGARQQISPFFVPSFLCNMATGQVAIEFGAKGANMCSVTACASGTHAIGDASRVIQRGEVDAMIAGGAEAAIRPLVFAGLEPLKVMSARNDEPEKASRPFDKDRDGFVIGEGAGMVILEELESALSGEPGFTARYWATA